MDKKYWLVKIVIGGFETNTCMYGDEQSLREYIQKNFNGPMSYLEIGADAAQLFMNISMKVYMCPESVIVEEPVNETSVET